LDTTRKSTNRSPRTSYSSLPSLARNIIAIDVPDRKHMNRI